MVSPRISTLTVALWLALLTAANAAEPLTSPQTPAELVASLGDPSFRVRETAAKRLAAMGAGARAALEAGRKSLDRETADRCGRLLASLAEIDRLARIDRFEKADPGTDAADLPFWKLFCDVVGDTKASRRDFARLLRYHGVELASMTGDEKKLADRHIESIEEANRRSGTPRTVAPAKEVADYEATELPLLFLLGCDPRSLKHTRIPNTMTPFLMADRTLERATGPDSADPTLRRLFLRWTLNNSDNRWCGEALHVIRERRMPEGFDLGLALFARKGYSYNSADGLYTAGLVAGPSRKKAFLEQISNEEVCLSITMQREGERVSSTIRKGDVALAALIRMHGLDPDDFGFPMYRLGAKVEIFGFYYFGFENDDQRANARKLWESRHANIERLRTVWAW